VNVVCPGVGDGGKTASTCYGPSHLVVNSLLNGQPVQHVQQRRGVESCSRLEDDPSCVVLHTLQLPDGVGWSTVEHSVAVIDKTYHYVLLSHAVDLADWSRSSSRSFWSRSYYIFGLGLSLFGLGLGLTKFWSH